MKLPSQKLFVFAIPALILLGLLSALWRDNPTREQVASDIPQIISFESTLLAEQDSDGDGVKDWEEAIWKTNPDNPNTYEMPDSDYIKLESERIAATPSPLSGPVTTTEELSHRLFLEYLELRKSGNVGPQDIALLTSRLSQDIPLEESEDPYTASSLVTFPASDSTQLAQYASSLLEMRKRYQTTYEQALGSLSREQLFLSENLLFGSEVYLAFSQDLMTISVPSELIEIHTAYANSIRESAIGLRAIGEQNDPLLSMVGLQRHSEAQVIQEGNIATITGFLNQNGIMFNLEAF